MRVVDAEARERREQVLDRRDARVAINKSGAELGVADIFGGGPDFRRRIEVGTPEHDARVGRTRPQGHQDLLSGVQPHALGADRVLECALSEHVIPIPVAEVESGHG